jgi:hypothetical protein
MAETKFAPTSDEIATGTNEQSPVPGGLMLDLLERARATKSYIPEAGGTPDGLPFRLLRSSAAWTIGETTEDPTIGLVLSDFLQGYNFGGSSDESTKGLQIASTFEQSQIIAVPHTFSDCPGDVLVDVSCIQPVAGATVLLSVGYALADGQVQLPRRLEEFYITGDDGSVVPTGFMDTPSDVFRLEGSENPRMARLRLKRALRGGERRGWVLIAVQSCAFTEPFDIIGSNLVVPIFQSGSAAQIPDPNHLGFFGESGYGYSSWFGTTAGTTGAKRPLALRIRAQVDGVDSGQQSWHAVQHIRPSLEPFTDPSAAVATMMFYPHLPEFFIRAFELSLADFTYVVDLYDMAWLQVFSVACTEAPDLPADVLIGLQPGEVATADSAQKIINPAFGYADGPYPITGLGYRVKGPDTTGDWFGFTVLEKNEAIPWVRYADTSTQLPPLSMYAVEGWSAASIAMTAFCSTPGRSYWLTVDSADESTIPMGFQSEGADSEPIDARFPGVYRPRPFSPVVDPTFESLPPDPEKMLTNGLSACQLMAFTPAGLADRFANDLLPRQNFPSSLLYPCNGTDSGIVSNFMVAGSLPFESLNTIFDTSAITFMQKEEAFFGDRLIPADHTITFTQGPPDDEILVWSLFTATSLLIPGDP